MKPSVLPFGSKLVVLATLAAMAVLLGVMASEATHFRYGHTSWAPAGGNDIDFSMQETWRRDSLSCIDPLTGGSASCTGTGGFAGVGDVVCSNATFSAGDATTITSASCFGFALPLLVTSTDDTNNWLFGQALDPASVPGPPTDTTIRHTYAAPGNYLASSDGCCRISSIDFPNAHINNGDGSFRVETLVNVGTGNASPRSALPPIVNCPQNALCSFIVPADDPDFDRLNCRLSTAVEASGFGFVQPGPPYAPNAASVSSSCVYTWDTTSATLGPSGYNTLYSTQVTIEDLDATGVVKSKVALDFLIQLVVAPPPIVPPVFTSPSFCGSDANAVVGVQLSFVVTAEDPEPAELVTLNVAGLPPGATMNPPLPTIGNPVSSTFSWTPGPADVGAHVVTFGATSEDGQVFCSITIRVAPEQPGLTLSPSSATNAVNAPHTVTATATLGPNPQAGITVNFTVTPSGGSTPTPPSGSCLTDATGTCTFTYTSATAGSDTIDASAIIGGQMTTGSATKTWTAGQPPGNEGCTPGYWKQDQHFDSWTGYAPGDDFDTVFGRDAFATNKTLLQALQARGGGINALARHAVAALLNASNPDVDPDSPFHTTAGVIAAFQAGFDSGAYETTKNAFEASNENGCPLN